MSYQYIRYRYLFIGGGASMTDIFSQLYLPLQVCSHLNIFNSAGSIQLNHGCYF